MIKLPQQVVISFISRVYFVSIVTICKQRLLMNIYCLYKTVSYMNIMF